MVDSFSTYNFENINFTIHVENTIVRLSLMDNINAPNYDRVIAIEEYVDKICQILDRREIQYTVIESMVLPELNSKNIEPFVTNE